LKPDNHLRNIFAVSFCLLFFLFYNSCKEPDFIGMEVQPDSDKFSIYFEENLEITAYTVKEDSIRTTRTVHNLLGNYKDPVFGRVSAGFYSHVRLSSNNVDFGSNPIADSLVLTLAYKGYYGKLRKLNVKVFEVIDDFYRDTVYYSNSLLNINPQPIGSISLIPRPTDSVYVDGQWTPPHLRIKLDNNLAQRFLDESGSTNLTDNDAFVDFFKGLYVTSSPVFNEGSIMYFDLLNTLSQMTLFYKNDENDSLKFNFVINDNCARLNTFNHYDYLDANYVLQQQIGGDTLLGDSILYLQSMGGTKIKLFFPTFKNIQGLERIALNKAELIIPVETNDLTTEQYPLPERLTLVRITETGEPAFIIDQFEGESHFRGMYDANKKQYNFIITRHLQNIIANNIQDYGLYLMVSGAAINGGRAVLRGPKHSENKITLKITYIKI